MSNRKTYIWDRQTRRMVEVSKHDTINVDAPFVIGDEIEPTESMATADGEIFTSLSKLKAHYKQHGYEITGGDHLTGKALGSEKYYTPDPAEIRDCIKKVQNDLRWNNVKLTEREKQICRNEERAYRDYCKRR